MNIGSPSSADTFEGADALPRPTSNVIGTDRRLRVPIVDFLGLGREIRIQRRRWERRHRKRRLRQGAEAHHQEVAQEAVIVFKWQWTRTGRFRKTARRLHQPQSLNGPTQQECCKESTGKKSDTLPSTSQDSDPEWAR